MTHQALDIADHFVRYSGHTKTNLQVLKLTYISHGHMLAIHDRPLISDTVEAWKHGPVVPSIFNKFKKWKSGVIGKASSDSPARFEPEEKELLDGIFATYGKYCGYYLSQITHENGEIRTPWMQCYEPGMNVPIPDAITQEYYKTIIR